MDLPEARGCGLNPPMSSWRRLSKQAHIAHTACPPYASQYLRVKTTSKENLKKKEEEKELTACNK